MTGKDAEKKAPATKPQATQNAAGAKVGVGGMTQVPKSEGNAKATSAGAGAGAKQPSNTGNAANAAGANAGKAPAAKSTKK
jgi:hypothetical protein